MEGPVSMQRYVPGVEPGPRAWKKEMREAKGKGKIGGDLL